jgi:hypothetical protein
MTSNAKALSEKPMSLEHFKEAFGIKTGLKLGELPELNNPLVVLAGTVQVPGIEGERLITVDTIHGKVAFRVGKINGHDVAIFNRHQSKPSGIITTYEGNVAKHTDFLDPQHAQYEAHAAVIAALNPEQIITMHAGGVDPVAKRVGPLRLGRRRIGQFALVEGSIAGTSRDGRVFTEKVQKEIQRLGYSVPHRIFTPMHAERLQDPELAAKIRGALKAMGKRLARPVVTMTHGGPTYETNHMIRDGVRRGASAFVMTYQPEISSLAQALNAVGSKAKLVSLVAICNYGQGLQKKPVTHGEVEAAMEKFKPQITGLLGRLLK